MLCRLIAIMLGRLRMTINGCIEVYEQFGEAIFSRKRNLWMLRSNKYKTSEVEEFMRDTLRTHCLDRNGERGASQATDPSLEDPTVVGYEEDLSKLPRQRYIPCRV